jgi:hypothetical protein
MTTFAETESFGKSDMHLADVRNFTKIQVTIMILSDDIRNINSHHGTNFNVTDKVNCEIPNLYVPRQKIYVSCFCVGENLVLSIVFIFLV